MQKEAEELFDDNVEHLAKIQEKEKKERDEHEHQIMKIKADFADKLFSVRGPVRIPGTPTSSLPSGLDNVPSGNDKEIEKLKRKIKKREDVIEKLRWRQDEEGKQMKLLIDEIEKMHSKYKEKKQELRSNIKRLKKRVEERDKHIEKLNQKLANANKPKKTTNIFGY
jgi:ABC-type Zn2+ transport system substrate-binding protein/surface adhesin